MKSLKFIGNGLSKAVGNLERNASEKNKAIGKTLQNKSKLYFSSLYFRNFRLFFFGQAISLIGTWMQNVGQGWLVLTTTNSPFLLGVVGAAQFLPMMLFSLYAGVIIDRFSKRKILLLTQSALTITALAFAILTQLKIITYWEILLLALTMGIANTFDMPARQSFYVELVGKKALMNAISLNSSIFNLARILGPAIAGILIGKLGYAACFYINAASFLPVIYGIYLIKIEEKPRKANLTERVFVDIKEGLKYIKHSQIILISVVLLAIVNIFMFNYNIFVPSFVKDVLKMGATGYGFVMAMMGLGALFGSLLLAMLSHRGIKPWYVFFTAIGVSISSIVMGPQRSFLPFNIFMILQGFFMITYLNSTNILIQVNAEDSIRGRVMSIYTFVLGGLTPFGALYAGTVSEKLGAGAGFLISGLISSVAVIFIYIQWYRRISLKKPIEVVSGTIIEASPMNKLRK
jgi:MFS family permease